LHQHALAIALRKDDGAAVVQQRQRWQRHKLQAIG
jgi:hypothetical protein